MFQLWLHAYQTKAKNPGNTVVATNSVFDLLMTSNDNDLQNSGFMYKHQIKAWNPNNTVTALNLVFDLLMTSNNL